MLDRDFAEIYGIETKQLKRAVRRNVDRFPSDFMLEFTKDELENLRCQIDTSSWGGTRYQPMAFIEHYLTEPESRKRLKEGKEVKTWSNCHGPSG